MLTMKADWKNNEWITGCDGTIDDYFVYTWECF